MLIRKPKCLARESTTASRVHCYWDRRGLNVVNETTVRVIDSDAGLSRAPVLSDRLLSTSKRFRRRCFRAPIVRKCFVFTRNAVWPMHTASEKLSACLYTGDRWNDGKIAYRSSLRSFLNGERYNSLLNVFRKNSSLK